MTPSLLMSIETHCPHCWQPYSLADTQQGKTVRCRACDKSFTVAAAAPSKARTPSRGEQKPEIILENLNVFMIIAGIGVIGLTVVMALALLEGNTRKPLGTRGIITAVTGFACALLFGVALIVGAFLSLKQKWHLAITDTEIKYRRGDKLIRGRIPFACIHSTKIDDYQERAKDVPIRVLFIYLLDEGIGSVKWPAEWCPQRNTLFLPNSFRRSLDSIQELIDEHLEDRRRRDMGLSR